MADEILSAERLRAVVHYDPETGKFTRTVRLAQRHQVGDDACHRMSTGYLRIAIDSRRYLAHRVAWLYVYGEWPKQYVDHINGDKTDNRIVNLRDVDWRTNTQNRRRADFDSKSGVLGVSYYEQNRKWVARIAMNGRTRHIGCFETPEEAHRAYVTVKRRIHAGCTL